MNALKSITPIANASTERAEPVPIESVEIHFDSTWSTVLRVAIKPQGHEVKTWPLPDAGTDSKKSPGFFAFFLAVIAAEKECMRSGCRVLNGAAATTFYSINHRDTQWAQHLLSIGQRGEKSAKLGSFQQSGKPGTSDPPEVFLRNGFNLKLFRASEISTDYARAEALLQRLYNECWTKYSPPGSADWKANHVPAPRCDKFIPRPECQKQLESALHSNRPIVWVYGEHGVGKTEIVTDVVVKALQGLPFKEAIWMDIRPNSSVPPMSLTDILAETGRQLRLPKLMPEDGNPDVNLALKELSRHPTLVVFRHFDEGVPPDVFDMLKRLRTSKAVVISCKPPDSDQAEFAKEIKVPALSTTEREEFLNHVLEEAGTSIPGFSDTEKERFLRVVGANPQRILKAITYLRRGMTITQLENPQVLQRLVPTSIEFFAANAIKCLWALSLFPYGADIETLSRVTGLSPDDIDEALHSLRGFVDVCGRQSVSEAGRRILADQATGNALQQLHRDREEFQRLKSSWYQYFVDRASAVGFCWDDIDRLRTLDDPVFSKNVSFVLSEAIKDGKFELAIIIGRECRYWQYVRGDWLSEASPIEAWYRAARAAEDHDEHFDSVVYKLNIRAKQGISSPVALAEADALMAEATRVKRIAAPGRISLARFEHARALLDLAHGRLEEAARKWKKELRGSLGKHDKSAMIRWYAVCLRRLGKRSKARAAFESHLKIVDGKFERSALMTHLNLAELELEENQPDIAKRRLLSIRERIHGVGDLSFLADWSYAMARCLLQLNDSQGFKEEAERAQTYYEALGKESRAREVAQLCNNANNAL